MCYSLYVVYYICIYYILLNSIFKSLLRFFFLFGCATCLAGKILVPWPGINPYAAEVWSPNHWTTRNSPAGDFLHLCSWGVLVCSFLFWTPFLWFCYQGNGSLLKWVRKCYFLFMFSGELFKKLKLYCSQINWPFNVT